MARVADIITSIAGIPTSLEDGALFCAAAPSRKPPPQKPGGFLPLTDALAFVPLLSSFPAAGRGARSLQSIIEMRVCVRKGLIHARDHVAFRPMRCCRKGVEPSLIPKLVKGARRGLDPRPTQTTAHASRRRREPSDNSSDVSNPHKHCERPLRSSMLHVGAQRERPISGGDPFE